MVNSSFQAEYDNLNMKELLFGAILYRDNSLKPDC